MASGTDNRDQAVICSICLEEYIDPKLLPCFHTFCLSCLEQHAGRTTVNGRFPCPQCRESVKIPPKGVQGFQTNFYITNVREKGRPVSEEEKTTKVVSKSVKICGFCRNHEARFECRTCRKLLCNGCKKTHKKPKSNRNHHLVLMREEPAAEPSEQILCPKHKSRGEILAYFCVPCNVPICMSCKLTAHEGHKSEDMEDRMTKVKKNLRELNFESQRLYHNLEDLKASEIKMELRSQAKVDEVLEQIVSDRDAVIKMVNTRSKCLETQLKRRAKTVLQSISNHLEGIDSHMAKLDKVKDEVTNTLEKGSYHEMLNTSKLIKKSLETLKEELPSKIECNLSFSYDKCGFDKSRAHQIDNVLGKIITDLPDVDRHLMPKGTDITATFIIPKNSSKTRSLAATEDGILICYDPTTKAVDTVTQSGSMKGTSNFDFDVSSIAVSQSGILQIASISKKSIYSMVSDLVIPLADDLPISPTAITASNDFVFVVGSAKAIKAGILMVGTLGGAKTWIFKDEGGVVFKKPSDIAFWSKGSHSMIIVTDPKAHRVVFLWKQGSGYHISKIYSGEGLHKDEEQFTPSGVCVDKLGNIFVSDVSSQTVIQLSRKGSLMDDQTLMFDQGFIPRCLTSTPECKLVVGSTGNQIKVIKRANP